MSGNYHTYFVEVLHFRQVLRTDVITMHDIIIFILRLFIGLFRHK